MNKLADLVGGTLGPKGRNVVLESKYGPPKIVNDGVTVAKEVGIFRRSVQPRTCPEKHAVAVQLMIMVFWQGIFVHWFVFH